MQLVIRNVHKGKTAYFAQLQQEYHLQSTSLQEEPEMMRHYVYWKNECSCHIGPPKHHFRRENKYQLYQPLKEL